MSWKLPRRNGTDQGKKFDRMTPEQKAAEFDASDADPRGYAERNFAGNPSTGNAQRIAAIQQREEEREAKRIALIEETERKGRHRK